MDRRWSRILALSMGIPLMLAFLAACGAGTNTSTQGTVTTIEVGSDFPTSQNDASAGQPTENGVRYAIDMANKENFLPGYKFAINAKDDVGPNGTHDQNVGANNVKQLIGDAQVAAIVGPLNSSVAQAEMPVANNADIALISPSNTNDCLTQETPAAECGGTHSRIASLRPTGKVTYFRTATIDEYQGRALAQFAYKEKGYKTAYVIDDTETYGAGLATNFIHFFQTFGGTIVDHKSIASTSSYENVLTAVASAHPDVLFFGGNDSTGGTTIRQQMAGIASLKEMPFEAGDGLNTSAFVQAIAPLKGGPVYDTFPVLDPSTNPQWNTFEQDFQQKYNQIGSYTAGAYDNARLVLNAIKNVITVKNIQPPKNSQDTAAAKTFRDAVISAIQNTKYTGLTGTLSFDANGDTTSRSISMYTIGDPKVGTGWKFVEPINLNA